MRHQHEPSHTTGSGVHPHRPDHHTGGGIQPRRRLPGAPVRELIDVAGVRLDPLDQTGRVHRTPTGHHQARLFAFGRDDPAPQQIVGADHRAQPGRQRVHRQVAGSAHGHPLGQGPSGQRAGVAFDERPHHRRPRDLADTVGEVCPRGAAALGDRRDPRRCLLLEDILRAEDDVGAAGSGRQLHGEDRVAAQLEEAVIGSDPVQPEDLGEQCAQHALRLGARLAPSGLPGELGSRQGLAIDLPVDRQREGVQDHHRGRDHELRQPRREAYAERIGVRGLVRLRDRIGDQPLLTRTVLPRDDDRLRDLGILGERRLDLRRLDPVAPDLHLGIGPSGEQQLAPVGPACQVAGAVHPLAGGERGGDEPL